MRVLTAGIALILLAGAPAAAHPGHGADVVAVEGDNFRYAPETITVGVGDAVVWFWQGEVARNHSVTADPGQAEQFDSDPQGPPSNQTHPVGDSFSHVFRNEGRFTYHCRVHPSMQGAVEVVALPDPGRPLKLSNLRADASGRRLEVRFRLSKAADVVARIAHRRGDRWRAVKTLDRRAARGQNRFGMAVGNLGPGRYRLSLAAYDDANRRVEKRLRFSLD
jgi:plastocyanin